MLQLEDIVAAKERIAGRVHRTPMLSATTLGRMAGVRLHLKAELFQRTGSFKVRGVFNKLLDLPRDELRRGLVSISAGNHAAALAYVATSMGVPSTIVMPTDAVASKVAATKGYGGEVVLTERSLMDVCREIQRDRGLTLVHPFDDLLVMAGQGTVGLEVLEDVPDADVVIVPVGGGGLIGGVSTAVKSLRPEARVIGVEPRSANAVSVALAAGRPIDIGHPMSVADGLTAPFAGEHTLPQIQWFVDEVVTVGDDQIVEALRVVIERCKLMPEPAGVAGVAALLAGASRVPEGSRVVAVISGGNADLGRLAGILRPG